MGKIGVGEDLIPQGARIQDDNKGKGGKTTGSIKVL